MNIRFFINISVATVLLFFMPLSIAIAVDGNETASVNESNQLSATEYLLLMQQAYQQKNYEIHYLNSLQNQIEPMQLIHGVIDNKEVAYFRYLNGAIRESLQYNGQISYFEQGSQAYSLPAQHNRSVFSKVANFDYEQGKQNYEYVILGKGRIAGKSAIAIRMISKDEYRYHYVIWCDLDSYLPLRLDTINQANVAIEQVMVVSLNVSPTVSPWLVELTQKKLPELVHIPETTTEHNSKWQLDWLPAGFTIIKDDQHTLMMSENDPVSYILLDDGIVNVSIYISDKKIALDEKQKIIQRGAIVLYSEQRGEVEINVVGGIPVVTAKRIADSISLVQ